MLRRLLVLTCLLAVVALAACSGSKAPESAQPGSAPPQAAAAAAPAAAGSTAKALPHPCTLLTAKDAEAVLGAGANVKRDSDTSCMLETPNPLGPVVEVKIEQVSDTWDGGEMMMKFDKDAKKVTGIGEDGYTFGGGTIVFKKGAAQVSVITSAYKGSLSKFDAAKLIAGKVAAAM